MVALEQNCCYYRSTIITKTFRSPWYKPIMEQKESTAETLAGTSLRPRERRSVRGGLRELRLGATVHPQLFVSFYVITYNWPFTNTSKWLETEKRIFVPFFLRYNTGHFTQSPLSFGASSNPENAREMALSPYKRTQVLFRAASLLCSEILLNRFALQLREARRSRLFLCTPQFPSLKPGPILGHVRFTAWHLYRYRHSRRD